ncbi:MAG TPA: glycosyl hydrolase [Thermoanaerobaculia bacterium]|nr:glycosyl hydrolase [Thermoanaerobaculia bacterium]
MKRACFLAFLLASAAFAAAPDPSLLKNMKWREVGPYRGGRSSAVEGISGQPNVYYFGSSGGGVWKTTDGGQTWKPVSDGFFGGSVGAVAVAPSDPAVVYAGLGEETIRGNVTHGDGMWKSTDAGKSWTKIGLDDTRHIGRVRVHPTNPDVVYVAAMGHAFGPSDQRGVYRSRDGGKTWDRVLFINKEVGAVDLILDPGNPRTLYASTWRFRRTPYSFESGGEGSALWKSTDGGDSWTELSRNKGMPKGTLGIIGITVSPTNPQNLYAIVEAKDGGVYRSRDGGDTWTKTSSSADLRQRAWYYTRIYADPKDEDAVYVVNVNFHKSKDGGKTWSQIRPPHGDNHDLWIAPNDPDRMIEANDGGATVSTDGGETWSTEDNQPTAQVYRISTDTDFPYRILGAQQDNSAFRIRVNGSGFEPTAGGESGYIIADPTNPDIVYGGSYNGLLVMINHRTQQARDVNPWPDNPMGWGAADIKERFQWNYPLLFSPNDPKKMYAASQHLFESTNGGASWTRISPDLTRNDKSKEGPSGGPITKDNTSVEYYDTIFAVAESPLEPGVIWAGSDDGLVHVTRDGGKSWTNVTPPKTIMPEWIMINAIDASPLDKGAAYVAATAYKSDDFHPYLYKTSDYGKTWTKIVDGIAADHFTRVVRADPKKRGLLFAGTERMVYVSYDDGAHWQSLQGKLPVSPIADLLVRDDSLIAATNGRGIWMLDDIVPLRELTPEIAAQPAHLFTPTVAWRVEGIGGFGGGRRRAAAMPVGAIVDYTLHDQKPGTKVALAFLGNDGKVIREYKGTVQAEPVKPTELKGGTAPPPPPSKEVKTEGAEAEKQPSADEEKKEDEDKLADVTNGHNRFVWDLRAAPAKKFEGMILWGGSTDGPRIVPGTYTARLTVGEAPAMTVPFEVREDPRVTATPADLRAQYDFLLGLRDKLTETNEAITRIRDVRRQLGEVKKRAGKDSKELVTAANDLDKKMTEVEEALYQTKNKSSQDPLNYPVRLNNKLAAIGDSAELGAWAPTAQDVAVRDEIVRQIDEQLAKLKQIWATDLPAFNKLAAAVPAVK